MDNSARESSGDTGTTRTSRAEYQREYAKRTRTKRLAYQREWYARNRERVRAEARAKYAAEGERIREETRWRKIKSRYGLTREQVEELREKQSNGCALCQRSGTRLVVDHDHATGRVRGLLCIRCNNALGALGDSGAGIERALAYVRA